MKKCTGEYCPMQMGYDFENCAAIEKCPYRTWPVTIADRIRSMTDNERRACGTGDAIDMIEDVPAADVAPIEALERLRDELYEQDLITMEGLKRLNTLIGKYTTVHEGGANHG